MADWAHFLPTHADEDEIKAALAFALDEAKTAGTGLSIVVNNKGTASFLDPVLGAQALNRLRRPTPITLNGVQVTLESTNTINRYSSYGVLLAVHASAKLLALLDSVDKLGQVVVVADARDVDADWLKARGSRPLRIA